MMVFELPQETETTEFLGKTYKLDVSTFLIIEVIKAMPSMAEKFRPTAAQIDFHTKQIQEMLAKIFGEPLQFPQATPEKTYVMSRAMLKKVCKFYEAKQADYMDLEYGVDESEIEKLRLTESICRHYPKGVDNNEQPDALTN